VFYQNPGVEIVGGAGRTDLRAFDFAASAESKGLNPSLRSEILAGGWGAFHGELDFDIHFFLRLYKKYRTNFENG
jgi:hypothetical protein